MSYHNHDDVFTGEDETYVGSWPWAHADEGPCELCKKSKKGGCAEHAHGLPKEAIPFPLDPDTPLPCHGSWMVYDGEIVTPEVRAMCAACPLAAREWCLQWALANREEGVWAATNTEDRRAIRAQERNAA